MSYQKGKKIKILLVTHYYPEHRGGIEIVAGKLAQYLTREGQVEITWMASNVDPHPMGIPGLCCLPMKASNWIENKIRIPYPLWSLPSLLKLWQAIRSADVIHLHDYLYLSNLAAFLFAQIQKKPLVITQHIGFIPYKSPLFRGLLSFLNQTLGCFVLRNAHQVVFISEVVQKYFSSKTRFRHSTLMIPNGVDTETFFPAQKQQRQSIRHELGLPLEKPVFLFVGRFVEKKRTSHPPTVSPTFSICTLGFCRMGFSRSSVVGVAKCGSFSRSPWHPTHANLPICRSISLTEQGRGISSSCPRSNGLWHASHGRF
jgi:glycosyltransferase involved in cell wall biosynthesis